MEELRLKRFGLVGKANDGFRGVGKYFLTEESMVEKAMEGIEFGLIVS